MLVLSQNLCTYCETFTPTDVVSHVEERRVFLYEVCHFSISKRQRPSFSILLTLDPIYLRPYCLTQFAVVENSPRGEVTCFTVKYVPATQGVGNHAVPQSFMDPEHVSNVSCNATILFKVIKVCDDFLQGSPRPTTGGAAGPQ